MKPAIRTDDTREDLLRQALDFATDYYRSGQDGKTLVIGLRQKGKPVVFAAGLRNDSQQKQLTIMARYLFAKNHVDSYLLITPAWLGGEGQREKQEVLAVELVHAGAKYLSLCPVHRDQAEAVTSLEAGTLTNTTEPLMEDLLVQGQSLPGIMRRELDHAYDNLRLDYP